MLKNRSTTSTEESDETPPTDEDVPGEDATLGGEDDESNLVSGNDDSNQPLVSSPPEGARGVTVPDASDDVDTSLDEEEPRDTDPQNAKIVDEPSTAVRLFSVAPPENDPVASSVSLATAVTPQPQPTLVTVVAQLVSAVLNPLMSWGSGIPFVGPVLLAALGAVRNEMERILFPQTTKIVAQQTNSLVVDPTKQRVLVIGVDGANLSRILADAENENFLKLIEDSTNSAPSIVGHTTISNPSWTAILTGVWGERTGVINNVFTPWTYDTWPTVFNQLESLETPDQEIVTKAIANWNVINAIAGAGSDPVDTNVFIGQVEGDTHWLATDDLVGDETVDAIRGVDGPTPNFLFSYFVGVDENGHLYGGASEQYAEAIRNVDDNLGEIMAEVDTWNAAHPDEQWTVMVVTDHGHQPQQGFGHGFQSPDETETFVIAYGSAFKDGNINLQYEIVDTAPTVVSLFGGTPRDGSDGVPLTSLAGSDVDPGDFDALLVALKDQIASNRSPDPLTDLALSLRTIFATIPYLVHARIRVGADPRRPPLCGDQHPRSDRRVLDRRAGRQHLPAAAAGAAVVPVRRRQPYERAVRSRCGDLCRCLTCLPYAMIVSLAMATSDRYMSGLLATAAASAAIAVALAVPATAAPTCVRLGPSATQCQTPGNVQIDDVPPVIYAVPQFRYLGLPGVHRHHHHR